MKAPDGDRGCYGNTGVNGCHTALDDNDFTHNETDYTLHGVIVSASSGGNKYLNLLLSKNIPDALKALKLCVGTTGFAVTDGTFESPGVDRGESGGIESTMTTVSPYARVRLTERLSAWGLFGFGTGGMTIRFDDGSMAPIKTDIGMSMGALGARGALLEQGAAGGMDLALKADAFFVRVDSGKAANSAETEADASRVRLVLEGGRRFAPRWSWAFATTGATRRPALGSSSAAAWPSAIRPRGSPSR